MADRGPNAASGSRRPTAAATSVKFTVPSDYRAALTALNKGRPIALERDSKLAPAFQTMAYELAGLRVEKPAEREKSGGLFGGLLVRK